VFVITLLPSITAFDQMPRLPDEVAYLFQAKMYAAASFMSLHPSALAGALAHTDQHPNGKWYSTLPPGWPVVLAGGVAIGAPFIVNPAQRTGRLAGHGQARIARGVWRHWWLC
jgi:hypothetical protein